VRTHKMSINEHSEFRTKMKNSSSRIGRRVGPVGTDVSEEASPADAVPSSLILFTMKMEALLTRPTRRHIPEGNVLHSHRRENLQSYIVLTGWTL
jgi:hypothetical protein